MNLCLLYIKFTKLNGRNSTPGFQEIPTILAVRQQFDGRRAGRMVRHNQIDVTIQNALPQTLTVRLVPNRWGTLEFRLGVGDLFGAQTQIMMARLDRQSGAFFAAFANQRNCIGRG